MKNKFLPGRTDGNLKMKYQLDVHTHTTASGHAYNSILEMINTAKEKDLELFGITDHSPQMPGSCGLFHFMNLKVIDRNAFDIEIILGVELNIMDETGRVDLPKDILSMMDVCIGSLHTPCIKCGPMEQNTAAIINAIKNPYVNIIGHPDDGRYPLNYEAVVKAAKEHGKLLEVNNSSLNPKGFRENAYENYQVMLELCRKYNQPIIIGSDAHWIGDVGGHDRAIKVIDEMDFPYELIMNYHLNEFKTYINRYNK